MQIFAKLIDICKWELLITVNYKPMHDHSLVVNAIDVLIVIIDY